MTVKWIIFIYSQAWSWVLSSSVMKLAGMLWLLMVLPPHPHSSSLPGVREKISVIVATKVYYPPKHVGFLTQHFYILAPWNFKLPNQKESEISFLCSFTHSFIHLFNKSSAYYLSGTVLGTRNRMESKTRHHSCLPAARGLSGEMELSK